MGGITWNYSADTTLTYHVTAGDFGDGTAKGGAKSNAGSIYEHSIVLETRLSAKWEYAIENIFGSNTGLPMQNTRWYSFTNYLFYTIDEHWSAGGRLEWFRDEDGVRVDVNGAGRGSYYETTLGINWQPTPALRIRPEIRWDWFSGQGRPYDSRDGGMTGTSVNQFTGGLDIVFAF